MSINTQFEARILRVLFQNGRYDWIAFKRHMTKQSCILFVQNIIRQNIFVFHWILWWKWEYFKIKAYPLWFQFLTKHHEYQGIHYWHLITVRMPKKMWKKKIWISDRNPSKENVLFSSLISIRVRTLFRYPFIINL